MMKKKKKKNSQPMIAAGHTLRPLKRGYPRRGYESFGLVVETDEVGVPYAAWISDGQTIRHHTGRVSDWLREILDDTIQGRAILWGANIGSWRELDSFSLDRGRWEGARSGRRVYIRDIYAWYPDRFDVVARAVVDRDWDLSAPDAALILAHIGERIVSSMREDDIALPRSGAHGAIRTVRRMLPAPLPAPGVSLLRWGSAAYFGGRHFAKFRGQLDGPCYKYDMTGAYARILADLPGGRYQMERDIAPAGLSPWGIYRARVFIDIPSLPVRTMAGGLAYPVGSMWGYWAGSELRAAHEAGLIEVRAVPLGWRLCDDGPRPFAEPMRIFGERRAAAADRAENRRWKLAANGAYGMLASARGVWAGPAYQPFFASLITAGVRAEVWRTFGNDYCLQQSDAVWSSRSPDEVEGIGDRWAVEAIADRLVAFRASTYLVGRAEDGAMRWDVPQCRLHGLMGPRDEVVERLAAGKIRIQTQSKHLKFKKYPADRSVRSDEYFDTIEWGSPLGMEEI